MYFYKIHKLSELSKIFWQSFLGGLVSFHKRKTTLQTCFSCKLFGFHIVIISHLNFDSLQFIVIVFLLYALCRITMLVPRHPYKLHVSKHSNKPSDRQLHREFITTYNINVSQLSAYIIIYL